MLPKGVFDELIHVSPWLHSNINAACKCQSLTCRMSLRTNAWPPASFEGRYALLVRRGGVMSVVSTPLIKIGDEEPVIGNFVRPSSFP